MRTSEDIKIKRFQTKYADMIKSLLEIRKAGAIHGVKIEEVSLDYWKGKYSYLYDDLKECGFDDMLLGMKIKTTP